MWIASKFGFFSIVRKDGHFHVRARRRADLVNLVAADRSDLLTKYKIERWPAADYRYRIRIPEDSNDVRAVFAELMQSIDYSNFKNEIAATPDQREKLHAYHEIWHVMARLQT